MRRTALFSVAMLGKRISPLKWLSLCILVAGIGEPVRKTKESRQPRVCLIAVLPSSRQVLAVRHVEFLFYSVPLVSIFDKKLAHMSSTRAAAHELGGRHGWCVGGGGGVDEMHD